MPKIDPCEWIEVDLPDGAKAKLNKIYDDNACSLSPSAVRGMVNAVINWEREDLVNYLESNEGLEILAQEGVKGIIKWIKERGEDEPKLKLVK